MERRDFFKMGFATGIGAIVTAHDGWSLEYYPLPSDKKCAVLYSTWCGSSRDAAVWISEGMGGIADVFDVRENPDLTAFEHIVIGGSIRSGATRQEFQDYLTKNKASLKNKIRRLWKRRKTGRTATESLVYRQPSGQINRVRRCPRESIQRQNNQSPA